MVSPSFNPFKSVCKSGNWRPSGCGISAGVFWEGLGSLWPQSLVGRLPYFSLERPFPAIFCFGAFNGANVRERRGELEDEEQTDTEEYRVIRERMGIQMGRLSALMRTREELSLAPTAGLSDASRVTDSLGAVGGSVGPTVNVADVNRRQLDVLQQILQTLRTAASEDVSSGATLDSRAAAVYG